MSFVVQLNDEYKPYLERYLTEVPKEQQKKHNYWYPMEIDRAGLVLNKELDMALLVINVVIFSPGEDHPAAYAFFIDNEIILLQGDENSLFIDFENKRRGEVYKILPYQVPENFKDKQVELKESISEAIVALGKSHSIKIMAVTQVDVLFDQIYIPRNISR